MPRAVDRADAGFYLADAALPDRLMVRLRTLTPSIEVRILVGHPAISLSYNKLVGSGSPSWHCVWFPPISADSRGLSGCLRSSMQQICDMPTALLGRVAVADQRDDLGEEEISVNPVGQDFEHLDSLVVAVPQAAC